jgi:hypothetical protein
MRNPDPCSAARRWALPLALLVLLSPLFSCREEAPCGPGTRREADTCVPVCGNGAEFDPASGSCVASCVAGTHRDPSGACLPDDARCTSGQLWDPEAGTCIEASTACAPGSTWVASEARCVPDHLLVVADVVEGSGPNDPNYANPDAVEHFTLPPVGGRVVLSGHTDPPDDLDGDGVADPDRDYWAFEVDGPAILRVRADSLGGSASGFTVTRLDGVYFHRLALGTAERAVERDLFLPGAGTYALVATDGLNLITGPTGPYFGGPGFRYLLEVRRLPLPTPIPLAFGPGGIRRQGSFPTTLPEDGTSVQLFELPVTARRLYLFATATTPYAVATLNFALPGLRALDRPAGAIGFVEDGIQLIAVDHRMSLELEETPWRFEIQEVALDWIDDRFEGTLARPGWTLGEDEGGAFFGLEASYGEVVRIPVTTSTGWTCVRLFDDHLEVELGSFDCDFFPDARMQPSGEFAVLAPYDGYYVLSVLGWANALFDSFGQLVEIPAYDFDLSLGVRRSIPVEVGSLDGPWLDEDAPLDGPGDVRYYRARPEAGQAFRGRVTGALEPQVQIFERPTPGLTPASQSGGEFAFRSVDGRSVWFGVADTSGAGTGFDLRVEPVDFAEVGPLSEGTSVGETIALPAGERRRFVHVGVPGPGLVRATIAPPPGSGLVLRSLDEELVVRDERALEGSVEHVGGAAEDGLFFELATADGEPLPEAVTVPVTATFARATPEGEGNPTPTQSQRLELPAVVSASVDFLDDKDWFRFDVTEPTVITATTSPRGDRPAEDLLVGIGSADGTRILAWDDNGGVGRCGRVEVLLERPGTYTVAVTAASPVPMGDYLLEVTGRAP